MGAWIRIVRAWRRSARSERRPVGRRASLIASGAFCNAAAAGIPARVTISEIGYYDLLQSFAGERRATSVCGSRSKLQGLLGMVQLGSESDSAFMESVRVERRLAAILAADIVGYSRLIGDDEARTLSEIKILRTEVLSPLLAVYRGRVVKLM